MLTIYHNPRCSKSRQTLQLLEDKQQTINVVEYLKSPPSKTELKKILNLLGVSPRELMRKKETPYQENKLDDPKLTDDQLIEAMVAYPILIERPIVVSDKHAVIGRPPENALELLS